MVPYVRKSFYKHYKDGMTFIEEKEISSDINDTLSIEDGKYKENDKVYKYALSMTEKELKQATEGLYHNLNSLQSRSGNQLPFSSLNYGTCTLPEGRMVIKALLEGSIAGVGKFHRTSVFPCGIFQYMKGVNDKPGTPNYDLYRLALKSTSQRLYPNYANVDWSGNAGYDRNDPKTYFSTMGCRTANGFDINAEPGQNPQLKDGRGNICPVTIILPTLAMEADRDVEKFMSLLDTKISEAKDMLIERFNWICSQSPKAASFMYDNGTMFGYHPEEGIKSALKHGTLAIGFLSIAETLQLLIGTDHTTEKGMELAKRIMSLFKTRVAEFKQKYKLNFGVYCTPAENLCHTALNKFKEKYGVIPNVSDKEFFTNSIHVPVWKEMDPFKKIDIESQLTGYSSAGCITYVECPSTSKHNIDALEELVNYAMDHDIPYFAINVPNDTCNNCGYTDEMPDVCPECGSSDIKRLRRVTGYLSNDYKTSFNKGKRDEVEHRVQHFTH
jgi:ribonucleoside-triphosphate reductase